MYSTMARWFERRQAVFPRIYRRQSRSLCSYCIRKDRNSKNVYVQLIQAKSRVAPIVKMTISSRVTCCYNRSSTMVFNKKCRRFRRGRSFLLVWFCYSFSGLAWIQKNRPWNMFIGNRVKEIRLLSNLSQWCHVPGLMNPADLPSRGCGAK